MRLYPEKRPYWFVDAKWICGLLLLLVLAITFSLNAVVKITDENHGPKIAALAIGSFFIRGDQNIDKEAARKAIQEHGGQIQPIPYYPSVTITEDDLNLSTTDIKLKVFLPLTTDVYENGVEGTAKKLDISEEQRQEFVRQASTLNVFTKKTNQAFSSKLTILVIIALLLIAGVAYFSAGWGRPANVGFLLIFASFFWAMLSLLFIKPPPSGDNVLGFLPPDVAKELGNSLGSTYFKVVILGVVLVVGAAIGKLVTFVLSQGKKPKPESKQGPTKAK